ncbi:MAG: protein kinase, partial [Planctomycetota bacterium]|nr:protein kinase [Planctomycetota bacterium]
MSKINKDDFLATLRKSNIIAPEALQAWLDENPATDGQQTALELSKAGLITRWQAKYLLAGRHLLRIANYVLLERLSQDDLGDLFIANHESLDRKVQIQFLATDLETGTPQCDQFLQRVGKVSELDHPNLIHLYDVDQERGRYYVVTEFFPGQTLNDMAGELDSATLANVLLQVTEALEFIHQKEMAHGGVTASEVTISVNNEVKLGGLALAPLRSGNAESPSSDYEQLGELASNAFRQLPITEQTGRLESLIAGIGSDFSSPEETRQGLMAYLNHPSQIAPADDIPEGISLEDSPEGKLAIAPQVELTSGAHAAQASNRTSVQVSNKPYLILGAAILGGLVILGATIFIAMSLNGKVEVAKPSAYKPGSSRRASKERDSKDELKAGVLDETPDSPFIERVETIPTQGSTDPPPAKPATDPPPAKPATDPPPANPATDPPPAKPATDPPPAKPATDPPPANPP